MESTPSPLSETLPVCNPDDLPDDDAERRLWLINVLGEPVCRKLGIYRIPDDLVLSVVIPVYNERKTIHEIIRQVRAVPIKKQIILVDDCSKDGTRAILEQWKTSESDLIDRLPRRQPRQRRGAPHRLPTRDRSGRRRPGRRPGV